LSVSRVDSDLQHAGTSEIASKSINWHNNFGKFSFFIKTKCKYVLQLIIEQNFKNLKPQFIKFLSTSLRRNYFFTMVSLSTISVIHGQLSSKLLNGKFQGLVE
jgi:hypothetical protein